MKPFFIRTERSEVSNNVLIIFFAEPIGLRMVGRRANMKNRHLWHLQECLKKFVEPTAPSVAYQKPGTPKS